DTVPFLHYLARATQDRGEDEAAEALFRDCLDLARERGDRYFIGAALHLLGDCARLRGDDDVARSHYEESLRTQPAERSWPLRNLAYVALHAGDLPAAETHVRESLALCREDGDTLGRTQCLVALA